MKKLELKSKTSFFTKPKQNLIIPKIKHPEQKDDEKFIGNDNEKSFKGIGWKTKRKGKTAYEQIPFLVDGTLKPLKGLFPTFIKLTEWNEHSEGRFLSELEQIEKRKSK